MLVVLAIEAVNREKLKILAEVGSIYGGLLKIFNENYAIMCHSMLILGLCAKPKAESESGKRTQSKPY